MAMRMATIVIMNPNTNHTMKVLGVDLAVLEALAVLAVANLARAVESLASQVDHGADPERVASQATPAAAREANLADLAVRADAVAQAATAVVAVHQAMTNQMDTGQVVMIANMSQTMKHIMMAMAMSIMQVVHGVDLDLAPVQVAAVVESLARAAVESLARAAVAALVNQARAAPVMAAHTVEAAMMDTLLTSGMAAGTYERVV